MNIGILTQPINNNYGGILQNYALQTILVRMGHEVETLNWEAYRSDRDDKSLTQQAWQVAKTFISRNVLRKSRNYPWQQRYFYYQLAAQNRDFSEKHLHLSEWLWSQKEFRDYTIDRKFDALIVGSDQTWRPQYNRNGMLYRMFLDFTRGLNVRRIAYAASFGVSEWAYDEVQTRKCANLLKSFHAVSVREKSGIDLCSQHLGFDKAEWMPDPTLLLQPEDYGQLLPKSGNRATDGLLMTYILDNDPVKQEIITATANQKHLSVAAFAPKYCNLGMVTANSIKDYVSPSVAEWLQAIHDADYVISDSFHGTVFSIIFNKPFITIGNRNRGYGRFLSLLGQFGLEDRLHEPSDNIIAELDKPIDWASVNKQLQLQKINAMQFLTSALSHQEKSN